MTEVSSVLLKLEELVDKTKQYSNTANQCIEWFKTKLRSDNIEKVVLYYTLVAGIVFALGATVCYRFGLLVVLVYHVIFSFAFAYSFRDHFFAIVLESKKNLDFVSQTLPAIKRLR